jgi:hypothetical protein
MTKYLNIYIFIYWILAMLFGIWYRVNELCHWSFLIHESRRLMHDKVSESYLVVSRLKSRLGYPLSWSYFFVAARGLSRRIPRWQFCLPLRDDRLLPYRLRLVIQKSAWHHSLMELSPSWEAASCAATQELPSILWNPQVHVFFSGVGLASPGTAATSGLLYSPRW